MHPGKKVAGSFSATLIFQETRDFVDWNLRGACLIFTVCVVGYISCQGEPLKRV